MIRTYSVVSIAALLAVIICSKHADALTDDQALENVPNVPVKWMDPFATVDTKEQSKMDWGPVPKPGDTGKGTDDSKTDVVHAVEDLLGKMSDVDKNTHDANEGHLIDFWLSGNELPPELMAHLTDTIGTSLSSSGLPDIVGTGLGSGTGNITFQGNTDSHGQGVSGSQSTSTTTSQTIVLPTTATTTTTTEAPTTPPTTTIAPTTTTSKGPTTPSTKQTTTLATTQAMSPSPTTVIQVVSVESTTPKLTRKQLKELRKLQRQKQRELKRQQAIEARRLAKIKKTEKAEQARIARQKAREERLARQRAKQKERKLKRQQQAEARRQASKKIKARALAARRALAALRKKARTDKKAAARLAQLQARFGALKQRQQKTNNRNKKKQKSNSNSKSERPKKLSAAEMRRQERLFLQGLMH